jgi:hypothetical protein
VEIVILVIVVLGTVAEWRNVIRIIVVLVTVAYWKNVMRIFMTPAGKYNIAGNLTPAFVAVVCKWSVLCSQMERTVFTNAFVVCSLRNGSVLNCVLYQ